MSREHSPLPWAQSHRECEDGMWRTQVYDPSGQTIADLTWAPKPELRGVIATYRAENAALIVHRVNTYDATVECLKQLWLDASECADWSSEYRARVEAIIAAAEGR